jgi:ribosomal-protein-alanine N-acetyltransferase
MMLTTSLPQILKAGIRDLAALRRLERECFSLDAWPLIDQAAVLLLPGVVRLKAVVDAKMVGFIAADLHRMKKVGWIVTLGVLPAYQRRGIARALLLACMDQMDVECVRLSVRRSNLPALRLYAQQGFRMVDTWRNYYTGGEDALVLEKCR